jgi:AbrB family looped-hinge helix DNA binding protein
MPPSPSRQQCKDLALLLGAQDGHESRRWPSIHYLKTALQFADTGSGQLYWLGPARLDGQTVGAPGGSSDRRQRSLGFRWYRFPMETVIDQAGRIVLPKPIRDALGLLPGTKVDISPYGAGAQVVPAGRTARLVEEDGVLVSAGDTPVDDGVVFALIDAGRK